jgi:hypothetical protein
MSIVAKSTAENSEYSIDALSKCFLLGNLPRSLHCKCVILLAELRSYPGSGRRRAGRVSRHARWIQRGACSEFESEREGVFVDPDPHLWSREESPGASHSPLHPQIHPANDDALDEKRKIWH